MADYYGGTVNYTQLSNYSAGQGGEFRIEPYANPLDPSGFTLSNSAYAGSTKNQGDTRSFQSFCLEVTEYIHDNSHVKVSSQAYKGGVTSPPYGDDLDDRTAYLYQQFALGGLEGYVYNPTGSHAVSWNSGPSFNFTRSETAGILQRVIWRLEGETLAGEDWNTNQSWHYVNLDRPEERNLADYWYSSLAVPSGFGIGNVRVLQLYKYYNIYTDTYCECRQDQLYLVPIPGAVLLGMLGLGAAGLKLRRFA